MHVWLALLASGIAGAAEQASPRQLFDALKAQDPETALYALSQGVDANSREPDGTTPLHYAAHFADARAGRSAAEGEGRSQRAQ